jgi:hypothetical protein
VSFKAVSRALPVPAAAVRVIMSPTANDKFVAGAATA